MITSEVHGDASTWLKTVEIVARSLKHGTTTDRQG